MASVMWLMFRRASLLKWCSKLLKFWEDMDLMNSPDSLQVDSPDPHPLACVMLHSGASLWRPPCDIHYCPLIGVQRLYCHMCCVLESTSLLFTCGTLYILEAYLVSEWKTKSSFNRVGAEVKSQQSESDSQGSLVVQRLIEIVSNQTQSELPLSMGLWDSDAIKGHERKMVLLELSLFLSVFGYWVSIQIAFLVGLSSMDQGSRVVLWQCVY